VIERILVEELGPERISHDMPRQPNRTRAATDELLAPSPCEGRAVGSALRRSPVPVSHPTHRLYR
jgi:hypothetical protein